MQTLEIYMENFVPQRSRKLEIFDLLYANIQKMSVCGELVVCNTYYVYTMCNA